MALIGKIRNNFWFVLLVLGLALAAFVIMDMVNAGNQGGIGPKQIIGEVAGQSIDYTDFQKAEQALYAGGDSYAGKNSAWNYLAEKAIIDDQAEDLGVDVSVDELMDLQWGNNLSPVIQSIYRNPQTGQVDMQNLLGIKQAMENGEELNPDFVMRWEQIQKQIIKTAKQDKINNIVAKSIFSPTFLAESVGKRTSQTANFEFVKIPFSNIDDSAVTLADTDYSSYISDNAFKYTNDEETRVVEYAVLDVLPTSADSNKIKSELETTSIRFREDKSSAADSLFVINNEGFYSPYYAKTEDLTGDIKNAVVNMNIGDVYGPYLDNGAYFIAKLTGKAVVPDSVRASHILRSVAPTDIAGTAAAVKYVDSLKNLIRTGKAKFADLASTDSQDTGTSTIGGNLGSISQGYIAPEFSSAAFVGSKDGGLYTVKTQFGVHLLQVRKRIFESSGPKYKIAIIRSVITPSQQTQDAAYEVADEIVSSNRSLEALKTAVAGKANIELKRSAPLKANDYLFGNLGGGETSREIVRWAFEEDTNTGDVSPSIYTYADQVNYYNSKYVLAGLTSTTNAGLATVSDLKSTIESSVRDVKKAESIAAKVSGTDLASIASSFGTTVETANNVAFTAGGVTGLGNEPKVLSAAFALADGGVSEPIIGNNGVFVVKTISKTEGTVPGNVFAQKKTLNDTNRGRVGFSLLNALKEKFKPTDNRAKYF